LPSKNKVEIDSLPEEVKGKLEIVFAEKVEDVIGWVLVK
jgi:ATP-dependent Lon protease